MNRSATVVAALALAALTPATASATDRYVVPSGGAASGECPIDAPCTLAYALDGPGVPVDQDDTVFFADGTYLTAPIEINRRVNLRAQNLSGPRPTISGLQNDTAIVRFMDFAEASTVRHLEFRTAGTGLSATALRSDEPIAITDSVLRGKGRALSLYGGGTVEDSTVVRTATEAEYAADLRGPGLTVRRLRVEATELGALSGLKFELTPVDVVEDLTVLTNGPGMTIQGPGTVRRATVVSEQFTGVQFIGNALLTDSSVLSKGGIAIFAASGTSRLRNVTAVSRDPENGVGVYVAANNFGTDQPKVTATNVIARGPVADVQAAATGFCGGECVPGHLDIDHSAITTSRDEQNITRGAGVIPADPLFVGGDDLHVLPTSSMRDAGIAGDGDGPTDIDGQARVQGPAPDIGADELAVIPPPPVTTTPPAPAPVPVTPKDTTKPNLTLLRRTSKAFTFALSEKASVKIVFARRTSGRRSGKKCVKPTKKLRRAKTCTRITTVGSLKRAGVAGKNSIAFTKKVGKKTLKPGSYQATFTPTDAAGNRGTARTVKFTIKKAARRRS
jgi:hypothetical protein